MQSIGNLWAGVVVWGTIETPEHPFAPLKIQTTFPQNHDNPL